MPRILISIWEICTRYRRRRTRDGERHGGKEEVGRDTCTISSASSRVKLRIDLPQRGILRLLNHAVGTRSVSTTRNHGTHIRTSLVALRTSLKLLPTHAMSC